MIKKVLKKSFSILMIIMVLFAYTVSPMPVYAATKTPDTLGDLQDNLESLKRQKAENDKKQQDAQNQIQAQKNAIKKAEKEIVQAEEDIEEAEQKIEESNKRIEGLTEQTEKILKVLQQLKNQNVYLEYISDSSSITELIMRISAIEQITSSNQRNLEELEALIKQNEELKKELYQKQKNLEKKIPEYQNAIQKLYGDIESYDQFELDIETQIKQAESQVKYYSELSMKKFNKIVRTAKLIDLVDIPYNAGWLKPLNKGIVTSLQGYRTDPITGKNYSFHSGIDIGGNPEGTPVYAAAAGTVSGIVSRYSCGGNMVFVDVVVGGKQYTTFYYHLLNINVKKGQVVTQNTVIGTVGGYSTSTRHGGYDGCTTGAHLHFGVMNGVYTGGTPASRVIVPPGFNNKKGYSFSSRTAYYG